jgi:hypothetical protein
MLFVWHGEKKILRRPVKVRQVLEVKVFAIGASPFHPLQA